MDFWNCQTATIFELAWIGALSPSHISLVRCLFYSKFYKVVPLYVMIISIKFHNFLKISKGLNGPLKTMAM